MQVYTSKTLKKADKVIYLDDDFDIVDKDKSTMAKAWIGNNIFFIAPAQKITITKGGSGSGNYGHAGRPGLIGGSAGKGSIAPTDKYPGYYHKLVYGKGPIEGHGGAYIVDENGTWITTERNMYRHTELYAMYVLDNPSTFTDDDIFQAQDILINQIDENSRFEDTVMEKANLFSVDDDVTWREGKTVPICNLKVAQHSPISSLNRSVVLLQRQIKRGNISPEKFYSFFVTRSRTWEISPSEIEQLYFIKDPGIVSELEMPMYKERIVVVKKEKL